MRAGIGYSDNPDTSMAGMQAAMAALKSGNGIKCDLVLVFYTARHDADILKNAISSVVGAGVPVVGGGAVGAISNDKFGYAGDQIILAALWLEGVRYSIIAGKGLKDGEKKTGKDLGERLADLQTAKNSPVVLFYDAIDRSHGDLRMLMATPLIAGIKEGLGFLPNLVGAGLQGDFVCTPTKMIMDDETAEHSALAVTFSGDIRMDSVIMHGCRPATDYYTVTKADKQTILEINGEPALKFMDKVLGSSIPVENYPFFLIFGINQGDKWGRFNEEDYASRLCLAIDKERDGIIMFEPDMVEGTEFQIMYRSLELDYMPPRMENLFNNLDGRTPVFALYINCAGRAAGYAGIDIEDAVTVQKTVNGRVPLMGIYTGVEIASVGGEPRGLDWTGVFCLFSVPGKD